MILKDALFGQRVAGVNGPHPEDGSEYSRGNSLVRLPRIRGAPRKELQENPRGQLQGTVLFHGEEGSTKK